MCESCIQLIKPDLPRSLWRAALLLLLALLFQKCYIEETSVKGKYIYLKKKNSTILGEQLDALVRYINNWASRFIGIIRGGFVVALMGIGHFSK